MFNAIFPIFLLIIIGFAMRHFRWLTEDFWNDAEKLVFFVLFPALLISKISVADLSNTDALPLISMLWLGLAIVSVLTFFIKPFLNIDKPSFTSVFQGTTRFNTYICLSLAENILGNTGLVTAVIIAAILIPILNFIVVILLQHYGNRGDSTNILIVAKQIIKNPLIIGCVVGLALNISNIQLPKPLHISISILGSTALPLGLLAVGAALIFKNLKTVIQPLVASTVVKLLVYPIVAYLLTITFNFDRETQLAILIFSASPTAPTAYILAKNMGGDHQLMSRIITFQTLFSFITFFVMFWLLGV